MKTKPTQEEIDCIVEERIKQYQEQFEREHKANVSMKYGGTFVSFGTHDDITNASMNKIKLLLQLMCVDYSIAYPIFNNDSFYIRIEGENKKLADFIQKFIDNRYKLAY